METNKPIDFDEIDDSEDEAISDSFICCVCLDLLYKPIVLDCGHVSCFWCVHKSMSGCHESHCPICRHSYHHFPTICEMLHFLLLKMYPLAYRRREKQVFEEEKRMNCFSPQLDPKEFNSPIGLKTSDNALKLSIMPSAPNPDEGSDLSKKEINGSASITENNTPLNYDGACSKVSIIHVLCPACKQMLFRPAALNCGHVYCEACIIFPDDGIIICKVCESPHPTDFPNVCLELNNFLENTFPREYAARRQTFEHKQAQFQHKSPAACSGSKKSSKKGIWNLSLAGEDLIPWKNNVLNIHFGVGCDNCGVFPIVGDRYKCQDCEEAIGFDLCGDCYNTRSKRPGRFNQKHTPDHQFKLIKRSELIPHFINLHHVDGSGAPVIGISASEDSAYGRIAIESDDADVHDPDGGEINFRFHNNTENQDDHDIASSHPDDNNDSEQNQNL